MPNIGVTCWSTASTRKPATPPIAEATAKAQQHRRLDVDADEMRRDRIADDRRAARARSGCGRVRSCIAAAERKRAAKHDEMIGAQQERPELSGAPVASGGNG